MVHNKRIMCVPCINSEHVNVLGTIKSRPDWDCELIVVKRFVHYWPEQVSKHVFSKEPSGVLNHDYGKLKELVESKFKQPVVVCDHRVAKLDVRIVDNWVDVAIWIKTQCRTKFDVKVIDVNGNI